ncbi:MAG: fluoride efflux transporter CrcB [Planctomycetota bacterium]
MRELLIVGLAGALGAIVRYGVTGWMYELMGPRFPWGTLMVNVAGCFLLGVLMQVSLTSELVSPDWRLALGTGFLGAMTTFSTFSFETLREVERGAWGLAGANVAANLALGLPATWLGLLLARRLLGDA